jgi:hypothetical protein
VEGTWNGCVNFHQASTVLVFYLLKDQSNSLALEWISRQIGRWGGSSRVNEGMGVNCPSVKALRPDHGWGNSHHTQSCREKGKRGSVVDGRKRERARATGIVKENWRNSRNTGSSEHWRWRVIFILDYFSISREGQ